MHDLLQGTGLFSKAVSPKHRSAGTAAVAAAVAAGAQRVLNHRFKQNRLRRRVERPGLWWCARARTDAYAAALQPADFEEAAYVEKG